MRRVLERAPSMLAYWGRDLRCRFANAAYERWFGVGPQDLLGSSIEGLLGPALFALDEPHIHAALRGEEQTFQRTFPGPDGVQRQSLSHYLPDTVDGQVQGFVVQVTDVTSLREAEAALREEAVERERADDLLRESEANLRQAQRLGHIGSWHWEISSDITTWSEELYRILGCDPTRLPPSYAEHGRLYTAQSWPVLQNAVARTLAYGDPYILELEYVRPDGATGWIEARGLAERDEHGAIVGLHGTVQEITARRAAREVQVTLATSEHFRDRLEALSPGVVYVFDLERQCSVYTNRSVAPALGYSPEEVSALGADVVPTLMHPNDRLRFRDHLARLRLARDDETHDFEYRMRNRAGAWRWFQSRDAVFSRNQLGEVRELVGTAIEIDRHKQTEQALRLEIVEREQARVAITQQMLELDTLYATSPAGLFQFDADLRFVRVNHAMAELNGRPAAQHVGLTLGELLTPELAAATEPLLRRVIETGQPLLEREVHGATAPRRDEQRAWLVSCYPVHSEAGQIVGVHGVVVDITARKQAEAELRESGQRLGRLHHINADPALPGPERLSRLLRLGIEAFGLENGFLGEIADGLYRVRLAETPDESVPVGFSCDVRDAFCSEVALRDDLLAIENVAQSHWHTHRAHTAFGTEVYFGAPVRVAGNVFGSLCFTSCAPRTRSFTTGDCEFLWLLAHAVGSALARQQAEQALLASAERQRLAIDAAEMGTWDWDMVSGEIIWSPHHEALFGYEPGTPRRRYADFHNRVHPDDAARVASTVSEAVERGHEFRSEFRVVWPDGSCHWIAGMGRFHFDAEGRPTRMLGVVEDITARKQDEEQLRASERFNRTVLESSPDCVKVLDGAGRLQFMNSNGACLLEIDDFADLRGQPWWKLWPEASETTVRDAVERAGRGETVHFEMFGPTAKGTPKWWDIIVVPVPGKNRDDPVLTLISVSRDVTAQHEAEEELRKSEERLALGAEVAGLALAEVNYTTGLNLLTARAARLFGLGDAAMAVPRADVHATFHPEDREELERRVANCLDPAGGGWFAMEHRVVWPGGEVRWLSVRKQVFFTGEGAARRPATAVLVARDVTVEKTAADAVRESESRFRMLATAMPQLVWVCSSEGECTLQGPRWEAATGQSLADSLGYGWLEMIHPDDRERVGNIWKKAVAENRTYEAEYRLRTPAGTYRWFLARAEMLSSFPGAVQHWIGTSTDIDDAKRTVTLLKESEQRMRVATEATSVGIWEWNLFTNTVRWDLQMFRIYGIAPTPDGVVSYLDWRGAVVPEDLPENERILQDTARRCGQSRRIFRITRPGEVECRDIEAAETVRLNEHRQPEWMLGTNLDITERKRAQERLRQLAADLSAADRRKDEFLATLAHELRNPLAPIRNSLELMKRANGNVALIERARATTERQVSQMVRLIDDLLDVSRITRDKLVLTMERIELASVVHHAVETCQPHCDRADQALHVALPPMPVYLHADPARLAQVLGNLLNNASKYTPAGGRIDLIAELHGEEVAVTVRDTGIGIPADMLAQVFDLFTQVDASRNLSQGGLGIGLALAKRITELHGGTLAARSEGPGLGSEFAVHLPLLKEQHGGALAAQATGTATPLAARRILVVDDNRDSAESLAALLAQDGHETRLAYDGLDAVAQAASFLPDVILLDIGLPGLDGHETCRRIRQQPGGRNILIVAQTGWAQEADRRATEMAGFDAHLAKPLDVSHLRALLDAPRTSDG